MPKLRIRGEKEDTNTRTLRIVSEGRPLERRTVDLGQIEEQANYTLAEYPRILTKERLRMIVALVRYLKTEVTRSPDPVAEPPVVALRGEEAADSG